MQTVKKANPENEKLQGLRGQMKDMDSDFQDMQRAREEAKKQLEAKFQDVYRKIQATKDYVTAEGKRVNDMLKAFQTKFEYNLQELQINLTNKIQQEEEARKEDTRVANIKMDNLQQQIIEEREERLRQTDEQLRPIRAQLDLLSKGLEQEKQERIDSHKELVETLEDEAFKLREEMDTEKTNRTLKMAELKDFLTTELRTVDKHLQKFKKEDEEARNDMKEGIEKEMEIRLSHQDAILDNISNFIKTFQDTLKILGKDVAWSALEQQ